MTYIQCSLIKTYFDHYTEEPESMPMIHSRALNYLIAFLVIINNNCKGKSIKYRCQQWTTLNSVKSEKKYQINFPGVMFILVTLSFYAELHFFVSNNL